MNLTRVPSQRPGMVTFQSTRAEWDEARRRLSATMTRSAVARLLGAAGTGPADEVVRVDVPVGAAGVLQALGE